MMLSLKAAARCGTALVLSSVLTACALPGVGPRSISPSRMNYNDAISKSWDEQLLLNLVRVRYGESPLFVDITAINASMAASANAGVGLNFIDNGSRERINSVGVEVRDAPVISYNYLQGEAFAKHVLTPLTPSIIEPLTRSGWSAERLLLCCIETVNGIDNDVPDRDRFGRVADLMGELQTARLLRINSTADRRIVLTIRSMNPMAVELRHMLGLDPNEERFDLVDGVQHTPHSIAMQGRSVLAVFHGLGYAVEVPPGDTNKVVQLINSDGVEVDSRLLTSQLLRVQSGDKEPDTAQVKVNVRGHWFWIDDTDLNSKLTLSLLRMLLFIKSVDRPSYAPVITIPAQ
ncbi:MAG TPA: hypothetical protein VGE55_07450 [Limnobacter sp.]|uniref:hypothetical protein n=1 Tax=Limnobacter sp. TaxID=2003368 RepID=UPI002ED8E4D7